MNLMIRSLLIILALGIFTPEGHAGVGDACPDGTTITARFEYGGYVYVMCGSGKRYRWKVGGTSYGEISVGDWTAAADASGNVDASGNCTGPNCNTNGNSQFPGWDPTGTTTAGNTTISGTGGMTAQMRSCVNKCYSRWDGTSARQSRKRRECLEGCGWYGADISISGGSSGTINGGNANGSGSVNINGNNNSVNCSYEYDIDACIGKNHAHHINDVSGTGFDCPSGNCYGDAGTNGWDALIGGLHAVAGPLAYFGSNAMWSNAYLGSQQAQWGAVQTGYQQCTLQQQQYMTYLSNNSLPGLTPQDYAHLGCNGQGMNQYAGFGGGFQGNGMGGFGNPFMAGGYTPGFMGGMMGPYGQGMGPYGGLVGGAGYGPGIGGGLYGGLGMGPMGIGMGMGGSPYGMGGMGGMGGIGMNGGFGGPFGGIGINGGIGGGMGGMGGPFGGMGGMGGPFGGMGGMGGPFGGMGGMGGFNPYGGGGINGGIGMNPFGGAGQGMYPYNNGAGSYWNGSGNPYMNGGMNGQGQYGNPQMAYYNQQQSNMYGSYMQQQGLMQNYYGAQQDLYGGMGMGGGMYGSVPYWPGNMGASLNAGFNFGI